MPPLKNRRSLRQNPQRIPMGSAFSQALQQVLKASEDDFKSIKGKPDIRSHNRVWHSLVNLPDVKGCRVHESIGKHANTEDALPLYECVFLRTSNQDDVMSAYEKMIDTIDRSLVRDWRYENVTSDPRIGFYRSVIFKGSRQFQGPLVETYVIGLSETAYSSPVIDHRGATARLLCRGPFQGKEPTGDL